MVIPPATILSLTETLYIMITITRLIIMTKEKCDKCGYVWESRKENPKECPECKSRDWKGRR